MCSHLKISVIGYILILFHHQRVDDWVSALPDHYVALLFQNVWPVHTFRQQHYTQCNEEGKYACSMSPGITLMIKAASPELILIQQGKRKISRCVKRWTHVIV